MKCQNCEEKATVHFTQLEGGSMKKKSFCERCAEEEGIMELSDFNLSNAMGGQEISGGAPASNSNKVGKGTCPSCGFTEFNFQQTGRLGCSQCYLVFADDILARLGSMHRGLRHLGKRPEGFDYNEDIQGLLAECQERLEAAIKEENYEAAASIRDEIQQLEKRVKIQSKRGSVLKKESGGAA